MSGNTPNLPAFVDRGGEQVFSPPFLQGGTRLRGFILRAERDRLAALCDRLIVAPSGGAVRCKPLGDRVVVTFAEIARVSSLDARDRRGGALPETDVAFWVPVVLEHDGQRSVAWLIPYLFVDLGCAVATGREAYGFPKAMGTFRMPPGSDERAPFSVDTLVIDRYGPDARPGEARLLDIEPVAGEAPPLPDALRVAAELLFGSGAPVDALAALRAFAKAEVPMLFLRQLRDIADPSRAAFQEILLAPARALVVRETALLPGAWSLRLRPCDSHPLAVELGLRPEGHPVELAFRVDFDFLMDKGRTLHRSDLAARGALPRKKRLAVLGGGLGSMSAVWAIVSQPGWQDRWDITVYQTGFRLGGKGASGRNADAGQRIEEHGLHVWFGFYDNAFREMRRCYAEWGRLPGAPLSSWQDAFKPHAHVVLQEQVQGRWEPWTLFFPKNPETPGERSAETTPADWVRRLSIWTGSVIEAALRVARDEAPREGLGAVGTFFEQATFTAAAAVLRALQKLAVAAADDPTLADSALYRKVNELRTRLFAALERDVESRTDLRRLWISVDFGLTNLVGILRDRLLERGFEAINDEDYIEWLARHGASEVTQRAAPVRCCYDLIFGFEGGDVTRPNVAAGTCLYGFLRMLFDYKGAVMWKMQAGMGDVVFTPLYEVLRARGVTFAFFHKVRNLGLSSDGERITSITLGRQATIRGGGEYRPLVDVNGLPCWPDRPLHAQLEEGEALRDQGVDLESSWSPWADVETLTLHEGDGFDEVILGIPPAALKQCAPELLARKPAWRAMVDEVATACTHAFQLWTRPDLDGLGYVSGAPAGTPKTEGPMMGAYVEPSDTWADMTHLLPRESWPAEHTPRHLAYFCGPLASPASCLDFDDHGFPAREKERVYGMVEGYLDREVGRIWPNAVDEEGRFRRELLVDVNDTAGRGRLRSQVVKANVEPTDRYTLSLKGTHRSRLRADGSGVANLFLTGDWIDNGFNAGCVEATVMAGLQCARAVTGVAIHIAGEPARLRPEAPIAEAKGKAAEPKGGVLGVLAQSLRAVL